MFKDECIKIKFIIKFLRININPSVFLWIFNKHFHKNGKNWKHAIGFKVDPCFLAPCLILYGLDLPVILFYSILFYYYYSRAFTSTHYHILYVRNVRYILRELDCKMYLRYFCFLMYHYVHLQKEDVVC